MNNKHCTGAESSSVASLSVHSDHYNKHPDFAALDGEDLPRTYLAYHQLESVDNSFIIMMTLLHSLLPFAQVWSVCPVDSSSSLREENAIVCCSMLGGLTASKCLCDEVGHAEPDLLHFITSWQQVCSTESLTKVFVSSFLHSFIHVKHVLVRIGSQPRFVQHAPLAIDCTCQESFLSMKSLTEVCSLGN